MCILSHFLSHPRSSNISNPETNNSNQVVQRVLRTTRNKRRERERKSKKKNLDMIFLFFFKKKDGSNKNMGEKKKGSVQKVKGKKKQN